MRWRQLRHATTREIFRPTTSRNINRATRASDVSPGSAQCTGSSRATKSSCQAFLHACEYCSAICQLRLSSIFHIWLLFAVILCSARGLVTSLFETQCSLGLPTLIRELRAVQFMQLSSKLDLSSRKLGLTWWTWYDLVLVANVCTSPGKVLALHARFARLDRSV